MVGVPALIPETFSCSFPKVRHAQTCNTEAIKHTEQSGASRAVKRRGEDARAHGPLCASAGRERGRRPWLSAARRTVPRKRGCEAEREDTDDVHAPGRPRLTRMPPAARMAGPTRATRHPCPWRGPTLDCLRLRGLCARPGGRKTQRRDACGLGNCLQRQTCRRTFRAVSACYEMASQR